MRLLCASVLELEWLHLRQSWSLFGKLFFDRIVYIDLLSITIYTMTAIAVEPAFNSHDRNVPTFKRVIIRDYSQNGRDQLGISGYISSFSYKIKVSALSTTLFPGLLPKKIDGAGRPTHFFREKPWGRGCFEKVYSNFQELHVNAEFLLFIEIFNLGCLNHTYFS